MPGLVWLLCIQCLAATAAAQSKPSPGEAFRTIHFYYEGKGQGVVLADAKICRDVHGSGPLKYDCDSEIIEFGPLKTDGTAPDIYHTIKLGDPVSVWMMYLVPQGAVETVFVRFYKDEEIRHQSGDLTVKDALRYRTWTRYTPDEPGDWTIQIFHKGEWESTLLSSFTLSVL